MRSQGWKRKRRNEEHWAERKEEKGKEKSKEEKGVDFAAAWQAQGFFLSAT